MANTTRGKALFNPSANGGPNVAIDFNSSTQNEDILLSTAYPTLALYVEGGSMDSLRAPSGAPVWREWLLNQPLNYGGTLRDNADRWSQEALKGVRRKLQQDALGVFSPAFARFQPGSGNGDGVSVTRYLADQPIAQPFPGFNSWQAPLVQLLDAIKRGILGSNTFNVTLGSGDDVVLPGWQGNSTIRTGPGKDIILSSPQLHVAVLYDTNYIPNTFESNILDWNAYVYYPTAYAAAGTDLNLNGNSFDAGEGDDLLYYDAGVKEAKGGDGDDILAPSFGSFNWGLDTLFQGYQSFDGTADSQNNALGFGNPQKSLYDENTYSGIYRLAAQTFIRGERALLSPLRNIGQPQKVPTKDTWGFDFGLDGYEFDARSREKTDKERRISIKASDKPGGVNFGLNENSSGPKTVITADPNEINIIGGSKLIGGKGRDVFYGIDPQFYAGFITAADGEGLRVAFRNKKDGDSDTQPPRYHAQELRKIEMFGGSDSDYFALGNPGNLEPWSMAGDSQELYRISGNADQFMRKDTQTFGLNAAPDIFEVNLTYAGENWTNTVTSAPGSDGSNQPPSAQELASLGIGALDAFGSVADAFGSSLPIFSAITAVGSFALDIASLFQPTPKQPISTDNTYYRDPIGEWRKKINIQDWDPSDSLVIRVDPSDPTLSPSENRWSNTIFRFAPENDSLNNQSIELQYKLTSDQTFQTLFRLENTKQSASNGAWYVWDFSNSEPGYKEIGLDHLGFFGQVEMQADSAAAQDPDLAAYIDQYDFAVPSETRLFRWNDTTLNNESNRLARMQSRSERIVAQLDTATLGYQWAPQYKGQVSSSVDTDPTIQGLSLDLDASKLWIREKGPDGNRAWTAYSYKDISTNPEAKKYAERATPKWSLDPPVAITERLADLDALDKEMTGDLSQLREAGPKASAETTDTISGEKLKSDKFDLTNLNAVKDIVIQSDGEDPIALVYHQSKAARQKGFKILRTVIDDNIMYPTVGLSLDELRREERALGQDLNLDGLIGNRPTIAAG